MCGINGLISRNSNGFWKSHADIFREMLRMGSIRGADSTGVFGVGPGGKVDIVKGDADGYIFTRSGPYGKFEERMYRKYRIAIGHNRSATKGAVTPHNAHPFKEGNIVLVHNGTIFNSEDLNKESEVDSHAIAHALNAHNAVEALGKINGAFALVWYNIEDQTLNLARNTSRPLFLMETDDYWVVCSEPGLPAWLVNRQSSAAVSPIKKIESVKPEVILSFKLGSLREAPSEVRYEDYKYPVKTYTNTWEWDAVRKEYNNPALPIFGKPRISLSTSAGGFKEGDFIRVVFKDEKDNEAGGHVFLGHPVIENEVDENIIVKYATPIEKAVEFLDELNKTEFFSGMVSSCANYKNIPIIYVKEVTPIKMNKTFGGETYSNQELVGIIAGGCPRCNGSINLADIEGTLIRRKAGGGHRVVCKSCIDKSVVSAKSPELHVVQ